MGGVDREDKEKSGMLRGRREVGISARMMREERRGIESSSLMEWDESEKGRDDRGKGRDGVFFFNLVER